MYRGGGTIKIRVPCGESVNEWLSSPWITVPEHTNALRDRKRSLRILCNIASDLESDDVIQSFFFLLRQLLVHLVVIFSLPPPAEECAEENDSEGSKGHRARDGDYGDRVA